MVLETEQINKAIKKVLAYYGIHVALQNYREKLGKKRNYNSHNPNNPPEWRNSSSPLLAYINITARNVRRPRPRPLLKDPSPNEKRVNGGECEMCAALAKVFVTTAFLPPAAARIKDHAVVGFVNTF